MSDRLGIRFKVGDAFPADDQLARWVTACAMAVNDLLLVNRYLVPRLKEEVEAEDYEHLYLARLVGAHLFEVAKFLERSDQRVPGVAEFIATLDDGAQAAYQKVKAAGPQSGSEFGRQLKRARDQFFHYSELLPDAEDHEALKAALEAHAESVGEIHDPGTAIDHFRARFADDIAVELSFPEADTDLPAFVQQLSEHLAAFLEFAFVVVPSYVNRLPQDSWDYIEKESAESKSEDG